MVTRYYEISESTSEISLLRDGVPGQWVAALFPLYPVAFGCCGFVRSVRCPADLDGSVLVGTLGYST
jgi:hypothetical protein